MQKDTGGVLTLTRGLCEETKIFVITGKKRVARARETQSAVQDEVVVVHAAALQKISQSVLRWGEEGKRCAN